MFFVLRQESIYLLVLLLLKELNSFLNSIYPEKPINYSELRSSLLSPFGPSLWNPEGRSSGGGAFSSLCLPESPHQLPPTTAAFPPLCLSDWLIFPSPPNIAFTCWVCLATSPPQASVTKR